MRPDSSGPRPSPGQALLTFRIIGLSLALGVTLFAAVSWFLHQEAGRERMVAEAGLLYNVLVVVAVAAVIGAILVWRARVAPLLERHTTGRDAWERAGRIQSGVIIVWALLEAPALFAVTLYFLLGSAWAGVLGVALIWLGVALTWPRSDWLGQWE